MDGTANQSPLKSLALRLLKHVEELESSEDFRMKIHFAEHIYSAVDSIEEELQLSLSTAPPKQYSFSALAPEISLRYNFASTFQCDSGSTVDALKEEEPSWRPHPEPRARPRKLPFRNLTLADAARIVLLEHKKLHGKDIERLLKDGGYRTKARHFQQGMLSAFERDGGFVNVGGNTWELKPKATEHLNGSAPEARQETAE